MSMKRRSGSWVSIAAAACMMAGMALTGCSHDTGETNVQLDSAKKAQQDQKSVEDVKNNPHIPPGQKAAILSRMQNKGQLGEAGRTSAPGK